MCGVWKDGDVFLRSVPRAIAESYGPDLPDVCAARYWRNDACEVPQTIRIGWFSECLCVQSGNAAGN